MIPFTLDHDDLRLHLSQSLDLSCNLPAEAVRQGPAISCDQFRWLQGLVARFDIDAANALTKQQTLDPVDVGCPLPDQSVPFPVTAAKVLLFDRHGAHPGTRQPAYEGYSQHRCGRSSPAAPAGWPAGWPAPSPGK